jgi:hypothetical protein
VQWQLPSSLPVSAACIDLLQHILVSISYFAIFLFYLLISVSNPQATGLKHYIQQSSFCLSASAVAGAQQHPRQRSLHRPAAAHPGADFFFYEIYLFIYFTIFSF